MKILTHLTSVTILLLGMSMSSTVTAGILYVTDAFGENLSIIDTSNGDLINSVRTVGGALAVTDSVKIVNDNGGNPAGSQFDLNGNLINAGIYTTPLYRNMYDGATDGVYNYTIAHNDSRAGLNGTPLWQNVIRFDQDWSNPLVVFSLLNRGSGITFDSATQSIWTTEGTGSPREWIRQYNLQGDLLSSFDTGINSYGLAFDSSDNTLWTSSSNNFYQYSTSGALLRATSFNNGANFVGGMEFATAAPASAPGTIALILLSLAGFCLTRRKAA